MIHRFVAPDQGDPHDHPWSFRSVILHGGYVEEVFNLDGSSELVRHEIGDSFIVPADHIHRIVELLDGECWTMIMPLPGPERTAGFYQFDDDGAYHRPWHRPEFEKLAA